MLCVDRKSRHIRESVFAELDQILGPQDLMLFNDTRVMPCRLRGKLLTGGEVELLLLKEEVPGLWRALGRPLKKFKAGVQIRSGEILLTVIERLTDYEVRLRLDSDLQKFRELLPQTGAMPIPPYIRNGKADQDDAKDYQSLFAKVDGSVAAPTASLHFTESLIERIKACGAKVLTLSLHLGPASFLALQEQDGQVIPPAAEEFYVSDGVKEAVCQTKKQGGRVVAVGTTVVRAIESAFLITQNSSAHSTQLFIQPGFQFQAVDAMITNFHQPGTTHLLLVEAFMGRELLSKSYAYALENGFRFLSYGDGMFLC